jgi:hypothetical protein
MGIMLPTPRLFESALFMPCYCSAIAGVLLDGIDARRKKERRRKYAPPLRFDDLSLI